MNKKAQLIAQLGGHMQESAGRDAHSLDRYRGFTPSDTSSGHMDLDFIMEDLDQPRKTYDDESIRAFAEHLKTHGIQQPIQLRWSDFHGKWLIVFGHRRYRAAKLAGMKTIPCIFAQEATDETTIRIRQLVENCQREDLAPMEMAQAMQSLAESTGWSNRRLADELGISHTSVARFLDLLQLPERLKEQVAEGTLAPSVAVDVLRIEDPAKQEEVGREITEKRLNRQQARQAIDEQLGQKTPTHPLHPRPREKELLAQTANVTVYRNPDVSDAKIQKELLAVAEQLMPERVET
ncbi:MAG: ParB/RepB/Spo0J family partition protein [Pirellulaceae bacterium]|nr:ParB/RepB/Spo0J family partition protein [Planctomycetales bacterium]